MKTRRTRRIRKYKKVGKVAIRTHTRTPRGPNKGKKIVKVKGHTRDSGWPRRRKG